MNPYMLQIKAVNHWFKGDGSVKVLNNINLNVLAGQFVALVGGSGCGKSTLLRAALGTHRPKTGTVEVDGRLKLQPSRDVGIVYQKYGLYQFQKAEENVAFGPTLDQTELRHRFITFWKYWKLRKQHIKEAKEFLDKVGLSDAIGKYPSELSGGMQQRVALAQALIMKPKLLLLDEPFGALDEHTREKLQHLLLSLYQENLDAIKNRQTPPWTVVFVTHELNEAFYIADRVVGLNKNAIESEGATIVWDQSCHVFKPDDPKDFMIFDQQKELLKSVVLEGCHGVGFPFEKYVNFWSQPVKFTGVAQLRSEMNEPTTNC